MNENNENHKNTLLIVDDESVNLKVLNHILGQDYTIYTASNGESAIVKAKELLPDLVILDVLMPGIDGYETLSEIKKCEETSHIPIIFITGLNTDLDEEKGLSLDAADYIMKPFSATIVKLRVKNQIKIVNQMRTIEHLSRIDQLTNLPNRRSFDERLNLEWKNAKRELTPISLLMIDIDHFKHVNDTYGHHKGDIVLKEIAKIIPSAFHRPSDFAARWGGEEFAAVLPNTQSEGAMELAEKIRVLIEEAEITLEQGLSIKKTVSIGVNTVVPQQQDIADLFITKADLALYAAKDAGRNKVIMAG
jgi:diguanylate cyclase (GGDEF)-like protein